MPLSAPSIPSVQHHLDCTAPRTHRIAVRSTFQGFTGDTQVVVLPNWTPGSYMIRDYARHIRAIRATDRNGAALPCEKVRKNAWRVVTNGRPFTVAFEVFAFELTVRTSYLDEERANLIGASLFLFAEGRTEVPATVDLALPEGWTASTALPHARNNRHRFTARTYDELVDSPIIAGRLREVAFGAAGRPHHFTVAGSGFFPARRVAADTRRIVNETRRIFRRLPYPDYRFLLQFVTDAEGAGGLEHHRCCLLQAPRWNLRDAVRYRAFLGLVAHEYFHVWNVKRIHDRLLGPFDYEHETLTELLWLHEGFTAYYDDLIPTRAGLFQTPNWLDCLTDTLNTTLTMPGEDVQSLRDSSLDAWIKFYKRNEESRSATVSYYAKGAALALVLDLEIRRKSNGRRSLDDVLRALDRDAARHKPLDRRRLEQVAAQATGFPIGAFLRRHADRPGPLPLARSLAWVGLKLAPKDPAAKRRAWIGALVRADGGRTIVDEVLAGSPAEAAGIHTRDELIGLDGWKCGGDLDGLLARYQSGDRIAAVVARGDRLLTLEVELGTNPRVALQVVPGKNPSAAERRRFAAWCGQPFPAP